MGQLVDLHARLLDMLGEVKTAVEALPAGELRVYDRPPIQLPEMPCVFILTPEEAFARLDTMTGERTVTSVVRLCVDAGDPQTTLLEIADELIDVIDVWVWNTPPQPIDRATRRGMRGVTPVFGEIATRGADFPIETQLVSPIQPAP